MPHDQAYYEAQKKIEEALKSGAAKLDCDTFDDFYLTTNTKGG